MCINGIMYFCCSECYVVSNECDEPTSCLVQPISAHDGEVMHLKCIRGLGLGFANPVETKGVFDMCLVCGCVVVVGREWIRVLTRVLKGGWGC